MSDNNHEYAHKYAPGHTARRDADESSLRKVVVAIDSFKGSLSSAEATACCAQAVREACPGCNVVEIPVADGGEGFAAVAARSPLFRPIETSVHNPMGEPVTARYFLNERARTAVIEMAQACGLTLVPPHRRNPMRASSAGLGEMIMDAINHHAQNIIIGIGGSATNDGGMGMLCALGYTFRDAAGHELEGCGENLKYIREIDTRLVTDNISKTSILVACDVDNPFCGEQGATLVYGKQKGADRAMLNELEAGMTNFAKVIADYGHPEITACQGGGAAGGIGGTLHSLLGASLKPGIEVALKLTGFDRQAQDADLIITGEGKLDSQTAHGKTPTGILRHAQNLATRTQSHSRTQSHRNNTQGQTQQQGIPVIAICGQLEDTDQLEKQGFLACLSIINKPATLTECIDKTITKHNLKHTIKQIINIIKHYHNHTS